MNEVPVIKRREIPGFPIDLGVITPLLPAGDEIGGSRLPGTLVPRPAAPRSVTKGPGSAPASVSANAFSNLSCAGGGAGKGLNRGEWREGGRFGGPGGFHRGSLLPH